MRNIDILDKVQCKWLTSTFLSLCIYRDKKHRHITQTAVWISSSKRGRNAFRCLPNNAQLLANGSKFEADFQVSRSQICRLWLQGWMNKKSQTIKTYFSMDMTIMKISVWPDWLNFYLEITIDCLSTNLRFIIFLKNAQNQCKHGPTARQMDGWIDGWMDRRMDGWTDRLMEGRMDG